MSVAPQRQRGVALLVALLVVALAVILVAALLDRGELALARTRNVLRSEQAEEYAQGLEAYAVQILLVSQEDQQPDSNSSPWAFPLPPQPVPGGTIGATMRDQNGCLNLNNLAPGYATTWRAAFGKLFTVLGVDPGIEPAIEAWLSAGSDPSSAVSNYYLALPVPYRPPQNGRFAHVSELRLVQGVGSEAYARIAPYVCAIPPGALVNVNTASVPVLQSLAPSLSQADAERLWQGGHAQYKDIQSLIAGSSNPLQLAPLTGLAVVRSTYFSARGDIVLDDVPFTFYSLIERGNGGIRVLERSRGSDDALTAPAAIRPDKSNADTLN